MSFGWPVAFIGLTSLAIPLVIHLLQKGYGHKVLVGTTRWLETDKKPRWRKLLVSQPWLLLTRLLLLVVTVFILAEPYVQTWLAPSTVPGWILVHPSVTQEQLQTLELPEGSTRWLAPTFPDINNPPPRIRDHTLWSLLKEADELLATQQFIHVVSSTSINNFAIVKPTVGRSISWTTVANKHPFHGQPVIPETIAIVFDEERRIIAQTIAKAIETWEAAGIFVTPDLGNVGSDTNLSSWTIWLSEAPLPKGPIDVLVTDQTPSDSVRPADLTQKQRVVSWGPGFTDRNPRFRSGDFPEQLLELFLGEELSRPPATYQILTGDAALTKAARDPATAGSARNSVTWPLLLLLAVFVVERVLSSWQERV